MFEQTDKSIGNVIVIGAGMAGLLAVRALANHFEHNIHYILKRSVL
jgi:cation diffusion facilitator CzcD-associated flavoprotein CzcO